MLIAEGSDWFWWYGDDHSSAHDDEFDDLFRRHLRNVYRLLQQPVPDELFVSNISTGAPAATADRRRPALVHADARRRGDELLRVAGGRRRSRCARSPGAMHQTDASAGGSDAVSIRIRSASGCYVRLDVAERAADLLAEGYELRRDVPRADGVRLAFARSPGRGAGDVLGSGNGGPDGWTRARPLGGATWRPGRSSRSRCRWRDLAWRVGRPAAFFVVTSSDPGGVEIERHPAQRPIESNCRRPTSKRGTGRA